MTVQEAAEAYQQARVKCAEVKAQGEEAQRRVDELREEFHEAQRDVERAEQVLCAAALGNALPAPPRRAYDRANFFGSDVAYRFPTDPPAPQQAQ